MIKVADIPLIDAIKIMISTPARIMGISNRRGALVKGKDADIVIFDKDINIEKTIINGKILYRKES